LFDPNEVATVVRPVVVLATDVRTVATLPAPSVVTKLDSTNVTMVVGTTVLCAEGFAMTAVDRRVEPPTTMVETYELEGTVAVTKQLVHGADGTVGDVLVIAVVGTDESGGRVLCILGEVVVEVAEGLVVAVVGLICLLLMMVLT
jgi:hypothetical protein